MTPQESFEADKAGIQDATVPDFLLPLLLSRVPMFKAAPKPVAAPVAEDAYGTAMREALKDVMAQPAKGYAMGGVVMPDLGDVPIPNQNVPQGTSPSPIPAMLQQSQALGSQMTGGYTPEMRNQLYAAMLQRQNSMPNAIGSGLASIGDAIARGYGRDQTNFLDKTMQGQKEAVNQGLGAFDTTQKMAMAQTSVGMELGKLDPGSSLSKMAQEAYAGPLEKLGYTKEQISRMPASQLETVANVALKFADIESQKELKQATIELQAMLGNASIKNQQAERAQAAKNAALEANKETAKHWITHPIEAFKAHKAIAAAGQDSGGGAAQPLEFKTEADVEKANPPDGTPVIVGGVKGTWRHK